MIHRDIKPANIILCWRGNVPDFAKVLDFGLVKDIEDPAPITTTDTVAGTPAYIAPETITASTAIGPAGDIYALGAVAFFLLTGRLVFPAKTVVEMCLHHVNKTPEPASALIEGVPDSLDRLILDCLEKEPTDRPKSAAELRERLESIEVEPWTFDEAFSWWEQNPVEPPSPSASKPSTITVDISARTAKPKKTLIGI